MYVPAHSFKNWVDALREAAAWSPDERERRKQLGLRIAREFSWTKTAEQTLADFEFLPRLRMVRLVEAFKKADTSSWDTHEDTLHSAFRQDIS